MWHSDNRGVHNIVGAEEARLDDGGRHLVHPKVDEARTLLDEEHHSLAIVEPDVARVIESIPIETLRRRMGSRQTRR